MITPSTAFKTQGGPAAKSVDRLVVFSLSKSVEIAYKSLRVRFFRSLITTMSLLLAISFLAFVLVSTTVADGLLATGRPELRQALVSAGYDLAPEDRTAASSTKQRWIIILSLLVCVVGIVNAQLMAVTERFREIGTMKCLGALDSFILRLFLLEAGMQGACGALIGAAAGTFAALFGGLLRFGLAAVINISWPGVLTVIGISTLTGMFLSLLGVLYPAIVAAKMQPVEAMRVEH